MKDDLVYLQHIVDALARITSYLLGKDRVAFDADPLLQDGVIRQLEIIGEASGRLSDATQARSLTIDWRDVIGMRNRLIHHYFGVDLDVVWTTAHDDLPGFEKEILRIIHEIDNE